MSNNKHVIVGGARSLGALAVIRSLGRAGYLVHAISSHHDDIGLKSNYAYKAVVHPIIENANFGEWVENYITENSICMIIPGGAFSPLSHPIFKKYNSLFPGDHANKAATIGRKFDLFDCLINAGPPVSENLPKTKLIDFDKTTSIEEELSSLNFPSFCKLDATHSVDNSGDDVIKLDNLDHARQQLTLLKPHYNKCIVQEFAAGVGVGVFILRWNGKVKAKFMHKRLHETPHTGGQSSYRMSWWNEEIYQDALAKFEEIDWQGVGMIEYRWNTETNEFLLMEMNLRFWGSLHLALESEIDFPALLADCFLQGDCESENDAKIGVRVRNTVPFEFGYLVSLLRDKQVPISKKAWAIVEAIILTLDIRVKNDLLFPGDRKIFFIRLWRFLKTFQ